MAILPIVRKPLQFDSFDCIARKGACHTQAVVLPESEEGQIRELNRMLQLGSPALVGADGENQQLATQRAADLLGVSRPQLIKLLEAGELPYHKAGSHRRIYLKDLIAYQKRRDAERKAALERVARESGTAEQKAEYFAELLEIIVDSSASNRTLDILAESFVQDCHRPLASPKRSIPTGRPEPFGGLIVATGR